MTLTATLTEDDLKQAVADWIKNKHNVTVNSQSIKFEIVRGCSDQREYTPDSVKATAVFTKA